MEIWKWMKNMFVATYSTEMNSDDEMKEMKENRRFDLMSWYNGFDVCFCLPTKAGSSFMSALPHERAVFYLQSQPLASEEMSLRIGRVQSVTQIF